MEIDFNYKGISTTIQCNPNDNMRDAYAKFSNKREVNLNSLYFLYGGKNLQTNSKIEEIMNNEDKKRKKMNIKMTKMKMKNQFLYILNQKILYVQNVEKAQESILQNIRYYLNAIMGIILEIYY